MTRILQRLMAAVLLGLAAALPARAAIDIVPVTSPGGITAWLYEDRTIPMVSLEASFRGGTVLDPENRAGATNLMMALLEEGSGDLDATAFAQARDDLAASFGFGSSRDEVSVSARMLSENLDASVELLRAALVEPRFDPEAVARVRAQVASNLRSDETDPGAIVSRAFYAQAFPGHPYAVPPDGTLDSVARSRRGGRARGASRGAGQGPADDRRGRGHRCGTARPDARPALRRSARGRRATAAGGRCPPRPERSP